MAPLPPAISRTPPRWFAAAPQRRRVVRRGVVSYAPWQVVHAREIGSPTSLCGLSAQTWHMFFDRQFTGADRLSCPECVAAAAAVIERENR